MLKFFRKIRQKLIGQSKFRTYLLYAIGEILLVVVGILIALQVNNWNENQKQAKLEHEYYCRLLEDARHDMEQIDHFIFLSQDRLRAFNEAVRLLQKPDPKKVEVGKQLSLSIMAIYSDFSPNNSAFEDLKSGANLNIITDKSVIKSLNTYFKNVEGLLSIIQVNANIGGNAELMSKLSGSEFTKFKN